MQHSYWQACVFSVTSPVFPFKEILMYMFTLLFGENNWIQFDIFVEFVRTLSLTAQTITGTLSSSCSGLPDMFVCVFQCVRRQCGKPLRSSGTGCRIGKSTRTGSGAAWTAPSASRTSAASLANQKSTAVWSRVWVTPALSFNDDVCMTTSSNMSTLPALCDCLFHISGKVTTLICSCVFVGVTRKRWWFSLLTMCCSLSESRHVGYDEQVSVKLLLC